MPNRTLIISAHALAGLAVAAAIWVGCALALVPPGEIGAPTTRVAPFSTLPIACERPLALHPAAARPAHV
jgi:hypothetical protein